MTDEEVENLIEEIMKENHDKHVSDRKIALVKTIRLEKLPYVLQQRKYGEGEMRLGRCID
jgi:hypothetical protein